MTLNSVIFSVNYVRLIIAYMINGHVCVLYFGLMLRYIGKSAVVVPEYGVPRSVENAAIFFERFHEQ